MFIAFMGVPGCGKSTTASRLGARLGCDTFLEPEENLWPEVVLEREVYGAFSGLTWFRNTRVVGYLKAHAIHQAGATAVVDSLFDKLLAHYMDHPSLQWLLPETDPYYTAAREMARVDYQQLPNPTHVIFVHVDPDTWRQLLSSRGRQFDATTSLSDYPEMQQAMYRACQRYCNQKGIPFLMLKQQWSSADASAAELEQLIARLGPA